MRSSEERSDELRRRFYGISTLTMLIHNPFATCLARHSHVRIFTEALKKSRSAHTSREVFDENGSRRGSSSDTIEARRGKVLINILENVNPESGERVRGAPYVPSLLPTPPPLLTS